MVNKSLREMLELLKERYIQHNADCIKFHLQCMGICSSISKLYLNGLTTVETEILREYFNDNKPSDKLHTEFYNDTSFMDSLYWWNTFYSGYEERLRFLDKLISLN